MHDARMQELLEAEAANVKPIEDEIEEQRRKVEAKTPITEEVSHSCPVVICCMPVGMMVRARDSQDLQPACVKGSLGPV